MNLSTSISVRLDAETGQRLERISKQTGLRGTDLIRRALALYLEEIERAGELRMPVAPSLTLNEPPPTYRAGRKRPA